jgi:hypothetical protein
MMLAAWNGSSASKNHFDLPPPVWRATANFRVQIRDAFFDLRNYAASFRSCAGLAAGMSIPRRMSASQRRQVHALLFVLRVKCFRCNVVSLDFQNRGFAARPGTSVACLDRLFLARQQ